MSASEPEPTVEQWIQSFPDTPGVYLWKWSGSLWTYLGDIDRCTTSREIVTVWGGGRYDVQIWKRSQRLGRREFYLTKVMVTVTVAGTTTSREPIVMVHEYSDPPTVKAPTPDTNDIQWSGPLNPMPMRAWILSLGADWSKTGPTSVAHVAVWKRSADSWMPIVTIDSDRIPDASVLVKGNGAGFYLVKVSELEAVGGAPYKATVMGKGVFHLVQGNPLDVEYDGVTLRCLLDCDQRIRREDGCYRSPAPWSAAQQAAISAHWSAELRAKVEASKQRDADRAVSIYAEVDDV